MALTQTLRSVGPTMIHDLVLSSISDTIASLTQLWRLFNHSARPLVKSQGDGYTRSRTFQYQAPSRACPKSEDCYEFCCRTGDHIG